MQGNIKKIHTVFDGSSKSLVIPVYQRNYDWRIKHCGRLFDDLEDLGRRTDDGGHFFGAVVGHNEDSFTYVIIDGQQRLTTTSLLMLALVRSLENGSIESKDPRLAHHIRVNYLVMKDDYNEIKFKLKPVKNDNAAYIRLLNDDEPIEASAVTANYRYFLERLANTTLSADEIWRAINHLEVMVLDLQSHDDPQRIFESINSTGLELSEADKIRNIVLMGLNTREQEELYEDYWNRIEKSVEYRTDWFIRLFLISKTGKMPRRDGVYEAFREYQKTSHTDTREILADMRDYAGYCRNLNKATTGVPAADKRLRRFNIVKHDVALPLLMPLLGEVEAGTVIGDDFANAITIVDTYIYRRFVCSVPTSALNKVFAANYTETRRLRPDASTPFSHVLAYLLLRRGTSGRFPEDDEFMDAFGTRDFYKINSENRSYTFECLENNWSNDTPDIANAIESQAISVEHIMPRTLTSSWKEHLGADHEVTHATWVNRIGNLTVTGYNSSYSNDSFESKKTRENGFADSPYRLNKVVKSSEQWTEAEMLARTEALTVVALKYWPLPKTSFVPATPPLPTLPMGDDETFTNRVIAAFEYQGQRKTVSSWKDAIVEIARTLIETHREEIFAYASSDAPGFHVFEGGADTLSRDEALVVPGLKVFTANSTRTKLAFLRRLFNHLDMDTDDLVVVLRNTDAAASETTENVAPGPYADLTKFLPQIEELSSTSLSSADTEPLHNEFAAAFAGFTVEPQATIPGKKLADVEAENFIRAATPTEVLAAISLVQQVEQLAPGPFKRVVENGVLARWLNILAK